MERCAHCKVASPAWQLLWNSYTQMPSLGDDGRFFQLKVCTTCKWAIVDTFIMVAKDRNTSEPKLLMSHPSPIIFESELPDQAHNFLKQAIDSLHAPDGAAMLAASAIDSMLKDKGYEDGSLHSRIEKATEEGALIAELADWAHEIRLGANSIRHADKEGDPTKPEEAEQAVEFAKTLGELWYGLPAKINRKRGVE